MTTMTTAELLEAIKHNSEVRTILKSLYGKGKNDDRDAEIAQRVWAGETQSALAMEYGLSVNRIGQIMSTRKNPNPDAGKPQRNAERDRLILEAANAKKTRAQIAAEFKLSIIRVNQIVSASRAFGKQTKQTNAQKMELAMQKYLSFKPLTTDDEWRVFVQKYEPTARAIATDMQNGMSHYELEHKYAGSAGEDFKTTYTHYREIYAYYIDEPSGIWIR